jgi:hypothetical protein
VKRTDLTADRPHGKSYALVLRPANGEPFVRFDNAHAPNRTGGKYVKAALDELFTLARIYNSSDAYLALMRFVGRFRFYSPFNAMLIYTQMPGARFVWHCSKVAARLSSGDQNRRPADCDPATDGTDIVCV